MLLAKWLLNVQQQTIGPSPVVTATNMYIYGDNLYGQAGQNSLVYGTYPYPERVGIGELSWGNIVAGDYFTLGLRSDSKLFGWGRNDFGQLGIEDQINQSTPTQIGDNYWASVAAKGSTAYGITSDNLLYGWGYNEFGQLGTDQMMYDNYVKSWTKVLAGYTHTVAIRSDGKLFTWGNNLSGQLGTNDTFSRSSGVQLGSDSWIDIAAGRDSTFAIRSDGKVFAWGENGAGQLGINTATNRSSPVQVNSEDLLFSNKSFVQVSAQGRYLGLLASDGIAYVAGFNSSGELGIGTTGNLSTPVAFNSLLNEAAIEEYANSVGISPYPRSWSQVAYRLTTTFAIGSDGSLWSWGGNNTGLLGTNDSTVFADTPRKLGNESWTMLAHTTPGDGDQAFMMAIRNDGTLWGWGRNYFSVLFPATTDRSSPVQIGSSSWTYVTVGAAHAF